MHRLVSRPMTLSDGTVLPKGSRALVVGSYSDPSVYANPEVFDLYRFANEREKPGQGNTWQHVTVSPSHFAFGYGQHACPGRFFAVHVMKLILGHLFSEYDLQPLEKMPKIVEIADMEFPSEEVVVKMRKRKARNRENIHHC